MWWDIDLQPAHAAPRDAAAPLGPTALGEGLLDWILPTLSGESPAALLGEPLADLAHADGHDRRTLRRALQRAAAG